MNYIKVINKAEILVYSTLISIMSGINRYKDLEQGISSHTQQETSSVDFIQVKAVGLTPDRSASINWDAIQQAFLSLLLWTVLGVAAGFLIGMLKHG